MCPFCAAPIAPSVPEAVARGATRAQLFLGALTLAVSAATAGCAPEAVQPGAHTIAPPYGLPPDDAGPGPAPGPPPAPPPSLAPAGGYGAPPPAPK